MDANKKQKKCNANCRNSFFSLPGRTSSKSTKKQTGRNRKAEYFAHSASPQAIPEMAQRSMEGPSRAYCNAITKKSTAAVIAKSVVAKPECAITIGENEKKNTAATPVHCKLLRDSHANNIPQVSQKNSKFPNLNCPSVVL